jgi:hypothetical protein
MKGVESDQTQVASGGCKVHVSWTVPDGFIAREIQQYKVYVNDTESYNESLGDKAVIMKAYHLCTCDIHEIRISAVDACGNVGKNHSLFVKNPEPLPELGCENVGEETSSVTPNNTNHRGIDRCTILY